MVDERRVQRSNYRDQALGFQLAACARSGGFDAMVLSDASGLLVASSPWPRLASESLASHLPMLAESASDRDVVTRVYPDGRRLVVRKLSMGKEQLFLAGVGRSGARGLGQLPRAESGVRRILSPAL